MIAFRRVVVFNGIDVIVTQGDLADRLVRVKLPRVHGYLKDEEVARRWAEEHPNILGGLLDLAAKVHQRLPTIEVKNPPRMADFAAVLACVDEELGTQGLCRYREQGRRIAADTLDHPFIAKLVDGRHAFEAQTSAEILAALTPNDKSGTHREGAPALRAQGWEVSDDGGRNHRNVLRWTIRPPEDARKKASQSSQNDHNRTLEVIEAREDRRENNRRGDEESPRDGKRDDPRVRTEASRLPQPSHAKAPRTCEDETASPARPKLNTAPLWRPTMLPPARSPRPTSSSPT